jgi:hypothetical protein
MSVAYRTVAGAPNESIVIRSSPRWWALILTSPFALTFNRAFMQLIAPIPVLQGDGFCGNAAPNFPEWIAAAQRAERIQEILLLVALGAVLLALSTLVRPKAVIEIDHSTRIIRVKTWLGFTARAKPKRGIWEIAFGDRPVIIQRDGVYFLHAGTLAPVPIAPLRAPVAQVDQLRAALATLTAPTT